MSKIERVKANANIKGVISSYIKVRAAGNHMTACCPFHDEKTPSFRVYDDHYHCFGCGAHGDVVDFVSNIENVSTRKALGILAKEYGERRMEPKDTKHEDETKDPEKEKQLGILKRMQEKLMDRTPEEGFPYFSKKGLQHEPALTVKSSFVNDRIFGRNATGDSERCLFVPIFQHISKRSITTKLTSAQYITEAGKKLFHKGLAIKNGFYPISSPWRNHLKYLVGPATLFGVPVILVEGYATGLSVRDALFETLPFRERQAGFEVVVTFSATNMVDVGKEFKERNAKGLLCFADGDDVGIKAAKSIGVPYVYRKGMDANDLLQSDFEALKVGVSKLLAKI